ncbi:DUF1275 domain-containing protein [Cetobacterium somerae]|uniref:YoaK family protein n=1 Tax=Cetobacterium sp. NK01 TaxID=2993530 RepID=UPI002116E743|nr:YoaK family protein [Cetobacterium sp. NK01]MCQ8213595.1 DUF1275 domain-containing protein [Cetobacterium sp. NK01]
MKNRDYYLIVICLCFFSGFINIITLFYFGHPISHFSGTFTSVAEYLYKLIWYEKLLELLIMIICFVVGAIYSAIISEDSQEKNLKKYGKIMVIFGCIILYLDNIIKNNNLFLYFLTLTMGFQNGMSIRFKGNLIRSTHMTGNLTDFGSYLGKVIKGEKDKIDHVLIAALEISQYTLGGIVALICLFYMSDYTVFLYSILYIICGLFLSLKK